MDNNMPINNYIIVLPSGEVKGFIEEEDAHTFFFGYYEGRVKDLSDSRELCYEDYSTEPIESSVEICIGLGVDEGDCTIYNLHDFISKIQESSIFDEEKQEIITKLMADHIKINVYDYQIDNILQDVLVIPHR
ncbi:MAG: hypothetical protein Q4B63_00735 [Clostridium perfringens]|nr:hypothetical protein [Clostridium perfringens]